MTRERTRGRGGLRGRLAAWLVASSIAGAAPAVDAQNSGEGLWSAFAATGRLTEDTDSRWRWWFDGHARFFDDSDGFETSIVRPGLGYQLNESTTAWFGYAWIRNDPESGGFDEHRIWQQLIWSRRYDWGTPLLRTRLEQRFDDRGSETGWRLRQFARWVRPLGDESRLSWRVWDEAFYELNDTTWGQDTGFRQNRAFAGMGYRIDDSLTLEFGYLNQHFWRDGADDTNNHIVGVTLFGSF